MKDIKERFSWDSDKKVIVKAIDIAIKAEQERIIKIIKKCYTKRHTRQLCIRAIKTRS